MMRIILDTNVIVAAVRSRDGASAELLVRLAAGDYAIALSAALAFEYEKVLLREMVPVFVTLADVDQIIRFLCSVGEPHDPHRAAPSVPGDPDDDFILDLAMESRVDYIVTHNTRDFIHAAPKGVEVVTPAQFLTRLRGRP
jgi:putative PIN family toxin of toxin-antitoxin system